MLHVLSNRCRGLSIYVFSKLVCWALRAILTVLYLHVKHTLSYSSEDAFTLWDDFICSELQSAETETWILAKMVAGCSWRGERNKSPPCLTHVSQTHMLLYIYLLLRMCIFSVSLNYPHFLCEKQPRASEWGFEKCWCKESMNININPLIINFLTLH